MEHLEKGQVISLDAVHRDGLKIYLIVDKEYYFPIGTIDEKEFSYFGVDSFPKELVPKAIVYLGDSKWSYKVMWSPLDEFKLMDEFGQNNILCDFLSKS